MTSNVLIGLTVGLFIMLVALIIDQWINKL
jgi:hypothetical protein